MTVHYTVTAAADLRSIVLYGVENSLPDPVRFGERLHTRLVRLAKIADPGRKGRIAGTREWVITGTPYIAVWQRDGDDITIVRVLHGARQWSA